MSTECENTPGAFFCKCKAGYEPNLDCRPMGDLGVSDGGIPDDAIMTSSSAEGFEKTVGEYLFDIGGLYIWILYIKLFT